jgi:hypothetical protein
MGVLVLVNVTDPNRSIVCELIAVSANPTLDECVVEYVECDHAIVGVEIT